MTVTEEHVDYVRFVIAAEPDLANTLMASLEKAHEDYQNASGEKGKYRRKALGQGQSGQRRYTWEAWGRASAFVTFLSYDIWAARLSRMDICRVVQASDQEIKGTYQEATSERANNRTVHLFSSPARTKASGRDAGGTGFAIGSHKSDLRLSLYKRSREDARYEGQFSGNMLKRATVSHMPSLTQIPSQVLAWEGLIETLARWRDTRWEQGTNLAPPV